jgi:hypothetical protein
MVFVVDDRKRHGDARVDEKLRSATAGPRHEAIERARR